MFETEGNSLVFRDEKETVRIEPWGKNSFRVRSTYLGDICPGPGALIESEVVEVSVQQSTECVEIKNGRLIARAVLRKPWDGSYPQIEFLTEEGQILLQELSFANAQRRRARQFDAQPGGSFHLRATFLSDPSEKIYGMGQYQQEIMNLKGCNLDLEQRNTQVSVPFYISTLGYGFLWNNPAIGMVHFGTNTTEWEAHSTKQLDYWITAGNTPAEIEQQYADATGHVPMMPEWGMGFWQCKLRYWNQEQVLNIAREYQQRGIPLDVLVVDYFHWKKCGDWRFDPEYFPDPGAMVRELHEMGIETMVSFWPQVSWQSENYEEMRDQGLLIRNHSGVDVQSIFHGNNVLADPMNPRTRQYVWNKCRENYTSKGIRAFWLDESEPGYTNYGFDNMSSYAGPLLEVSNEYPKEYARIFYEGLKADGQDDIINLIRCAWAGSQKYATLVWSGDIFSSYVDFRRQICAGIQIGLAGIPWWTTDIGGFFGGDPTDESFRKLFVRWFQFGTFCPVMRLHGRREPYVDLFNKAGELIEGTGADNEIWSYGDEVYDICRKYIDIRESMRPYLRRIMQEAHETGAPVIRALFFEFPEDEKAYDRADEYMFGPDLLVAPVCYENSYEREVYLPKGTLWKLLSTGEVFEGGREYLVKAPLEVIPVFTRGADLACGFTI